MGMQAIFFSKLYKSDTDIHFTFINDSGVALTEVDKKELDTDLTLAELKCALNGMYLVTECIKSGICRKSIMAQCA